MSVTEQGLLAGRYQLRALLGRGGMAEVHDGWDLRLNRAVAVKLLHPTLQTQPDVRRRFETEARSAASLAHPNIVAIYDYGEHDGAPYIVMERLPGQTLADVLDRGPMRPDLVRRMLDDVLSALTAAHTAGVLHRDIKPANILVSGDGGSVKVADFGIAKTGGPAHTVAGQIIGTMAYMSPARVSGAPASVADDLYAVGLMGFEALAGRPAFPHDNPAALARAIMDDPRPSAAAVSPDATLATTIDGAITGSFTAAAQMRSALGGQYFGPRPATPVLAEPLPPVATRLVATPRHGGRFSTRTRRTLVAVGVTSALAVSAVAFATDPFTTTPSPEPVSTSTSIPAPPPPAPVAPVTPISEPLPPPTVEPPPPGKKAGPGNGNGNGNKPNPGHGQGKKPD